MLIKKISDGVKNSYVRVAISGLPNSGKTMSSLLLACGMTNYGRVLLLDCENGRAIRKASSKEFLNLTGGWQPDFVDFPLESNSLNFDIYLEALEAALQNKYQLIIFDSISVAWQNISNLHKDPELKAKFRNDYIRWGVVKKSYSDFVERLLLAPIHSISTVLTRTVPKGSGFRDVDNYGVNYLWAPDFLRVLDFVLEIVNSSTHLSEVVRSDLNDYPVGKKFTPAVKDGSNIAGYLQNLANGGMLSERQQKCIDRIRDMLMQLPQEAKLKFLDGVKPDDFLVGLNEYPFEKLVEIGKLLKSIQEQQ